MFYQTEENPDKFWQEYELKTGEKVLAKSMGYYLSGWEDFDSQGLIGVGGLIIASSGGFRFLYMPPNHWTQDFAFFRRREKPEEKSFFISGENIISAQCVVEKRWWIKLFFPTTPKILIMYRDETGNERQLSLKSDFKPHVLVEKILSAGTKNEK